MEIFGELIKKEPGLLSKPIEELAPISFVGSAAVSAYRSLISRLDSLPMTEEQKAKTLRDGQDAGKMLLAIEARIGEIYDEAERIKPVHVRSEDGKHGAGTLPGIDEPGTKGAMKKAHGKNHMDIAQTIFKNKEAVEEVIREAEENEDIPTKTAVINKVRAQKAEEKIREFNKNFGTEPKPDLSKFMEKAIEHQHQVNIVLGRFFDHPDQVDGERMSYLVGLIRRAVEIITERSEVKESWKQLR